MFQRPLLNYSDTDLQSKYVLFQFSGEIMATMTGHLMGQMFTCCMLGNDQHNSRPRPRIDRSMIGHPTDFRHTGHIGTNDMLNSNAQSNDMVSWVFEFPAIESKNSDIFQK